MGIKGKRKWLANFRRQTAVVAQPGQDIKLPIRRRKLRLGYPSLSLVVRQLNLACQILASHFEGRNRGVLIGGAAACILDEALNHRCRSRQLRAGNIPAACGSVSDHLVVARQLRHDNREGIAFFGRKNYF